MNNLSIKTTLAFVVLGVAFAGCQTTNAPTKREINKVVQAEMHKKATSRAPTHREAEVVNADGEKLRCETETLTGSRLGGQEVCFTEKEWSDIRSENAKELHKISIEGAKNYK